MTSRRLRSLLFVMSGIILCVTIVTGCQRVTLLSAEQTITEEKITLTFRHFWVGEHDKPVERIISDVIAEFEYSHPHIKIDFEGLEQSIHREQRLKSEMVTGRPPDIFCLFGGAEIEPYVNSERLLDLTEFIQQAGIADKFTDLSLWTFGDKVYGLPLEGNAEPIFYNKELFAELGISAPHTLAELINAVEILKKHDIIPFALGNTQLWPAAIYVQYLMDRRVGSNLLEKIVKGDASFNNPAYLQAMKDFDRLVMMGAFPTHANQLTTEQAAALFTEKKAGMYLSGNWDISLFQKDSNDHFGDKVGVIPFPVMQTGDQQAMAGGYTLGIGLSSYLSEKKQEAALELLQYIYSPEIQERLMYEAYRIPAMSIEVDEVRVGPILSQVIQLAAQNKAMFVPYDNMLPPELKKEFLRVISDLFDGISSPEESLLDLEQKAVDYWRMRQIR